MLSDMVIKPMSVKQFNGYRAMGIVLALLCLALPLFGGEWSDAVHAPQSATQEPLVRYRARLDGERLQVEVEHAPGAHTYAFDNQERGGLSTNTSVTISGGLVVAGPWTFSPEPEQVAGEWAFAESEILSVPVRSTGEGTALIDIRGQVCTTSCFEVEVQIALALSGTTKTDGPASIDTQPKAFTPSKTIAPPSPDRLNEYQGKYILGPWGGASLATAASDWGAFILMCISGGLIALLMPCVYPMIPITVSFFAKQAAAQNRPAVGAGLMYGGGLMFSYTALGMGLMAAFGSTGVTDFGSNMWVAASVGLLFLVFALSMFGMFELRLPHGLAQKFNLGGKVSGIGGAFLLGTTFAVTSMACTVPVVSLILAFAADGEMLRPIVGMLVYSGVIAAPFVLLALVPGLLSTMPKAGGWMNSVKMVFGFVEVAAAAEFFGWARWISREAVLAVWVACALLCALFLLGLFRGTHDSKPEGIAPARIAFATIFLAIGLWVSTGLYGGKLGSFIESFLIHPDSPEWIVNPDLKQTLADAQTQGKPVFIDVTGPSCTNCRYFEEAVLEQEWGKRALKDFVKVRLYLNNPEHKKVYLTFTKTLFEQIGMPQYIVINAAGNITAQSGDIEAFNVRKGDSSKTPELFQKFIDTIKTRGHAFTLDGGFLPPQS